MVVNSSDIDWFSYLSLITDAYSRKIVGFALHPTLEATGCINALQMALSERKKESEYNLIHHSDRGIQYCLGR
ncbi:DDE-type integrase/transposase/recombinase [Chryseobacterium carnipullorum]|uniref:DDE-type integrase/transposase/recombinase n=1 Tax=Chryseobacterium carnipullorum TaxID=1124835 RepID=UPI003C6C5AB4